MKNYQSVTLQSPLDNSLHIFLNPPPSRSLSFGINVVKWLAGCLVSNHNQLPSLCSTAMCADRVENRRLCSDTEWLRRSSTGEWLDEAKIAVNLNATWNGRAKALQQEVNQICFMDKINSRTDFVSILKCFDTGRASWIWSQNIIRVQWRF